MKKFILLLSLLLIGCPASQDATLKIGDNKMLKRIGDEFEIKVSIENATQVVGLNAWISYDPTIVEVVDTDLVTPGTQVQSTDLGFFSPAQLLVGLQKDQDGDEIPGTLICGYVSLPLSAKSGDGDAFSILFKAIGQGTTEINFVVDHASLEDLEGPVPTNIFGDVVEVPANATLRITVI